jgi:SAM-dependent methyltransferase
MKDHTMASESDHAGATDWTEYYQRPGKFAFITRSYTTHALIGLLQQLLPGGVPWMVELGGGNSCLFPKLPRQLGCRRYTVIDNNDLGLKLFLSKAAGQGIEVEGVAADLVGATLDLAADAVISIGLIEHFPPAERARAIDAHFQCLRPGGVAVILFPTPTWLYRAARWASEAMGTWDFWDETPLRPEEVINAIGPGMQLLDRRIHWPQVFTQCSLVFRKS